MDRIHKCAGLDICPGFWKWLESARLDDEIIFIEPVLDEIKEGSDELTDWANRMPKHFFETIDQPTVKALPIVTNWVQNEDFKEEAKRHFLAKADPLLIAYALSHEDVILATHEVHVEGERKRVKIPTVCRALEVRCERTFGMLRHLNAKFGLAN
jgi:hypothetical protein